MRSAAFLCSSAIALISSVTVTSATYAQSAGAPDSAEPNAAPAAATPTASTPASVNDPIQDIVVTANKRAQSLQGVPIAVTAVAESRLQSLNLTNVSNISAVAPSVVFVPAPNPNSVQFVVRGIGTFAFADTLEQSVGVAIDGVPLGRIAGAAVDVVDVARVEVLRGPQGTVFGKSATAGLISIVTNKANLADTGFTGRAFYGENKEMRAQGTANVVLSQDRLALRLSAWDFRRDGYINAPNQPGDHNIGDFHNRGVRAKLGFQVNDSWRIDASAEIARNSNDGVLQTTRSYYSADTTAVPGGITIAQLNANAGIIPGPRNLTQGAEQPLGGFVKPQFYELESNWDLGGPTLTSLSAFRKVKSDQVSEFDYSGSVPNSYQTYQHYFSDTEQFTTELRLASSGASKFQYTLGLFFYNLDVNGSTIEQTFKNNPGLTAATNYSAGRRIVADMNTKNYAAFADTSYALGKFKLIGGARLSYEKSSGHVRRGLPTDGAAAEGNLALYIPSQTIATFGPLDLSTTTDYTDFSWRAGVQYQFTPTVMAYATASRAYKGPGFNFANDLTTTIFNSTQSIVKPEIAHSYEVGLRSQFFDRTVTMNLSAYYAPFSDFQITAALPGTGGTGLTYTIINAGKIKTKGLEAEFGWRPRGPLEGLSFDGNVSYNDAYYSDFANAPCYLGQAVAAAPTTTPGVCAPIAVGSSATLQSVKGLRTVGAAKYQLNLFAGYDRPITDRFNGFLQAHYFSQTAIQLGVGNNPATKAPGYHTVDFTIGVHAPDDKWRLSVIGKNVFNKFFITRLVTNNPGLEQVVPYEAFSSWGVALDVKF